MHPNVADPSTSNATPTATFNIESAGVTEELTWSRDSIPPEKLSAISVFDSRCARSYLTNEHDVAYLPYGLDIVENLANQVLPKLTEMIDAEINTINLDKRPFEGLLGDTEVGKLFSSISARTEAASFEQLGTLSEQDLRRLGELEKALSEPDPAKKANDLILSVKRLKLTADKLIRPVTWVSTGAVDKLIKIDREKTEAENLEKQAAEALQAGESLLPGTGNQVWKALIGAARKYSIEVAYPETEFPNVDDGAACPLCQTTLSDEASARIQRFNQYITNDIAKTATLAREKLSDVKGKIESANLQVILDQPAIEELSQLEESLPKMVTIFQNSIEQRRLWMLENLNSHDWADAPELADNPRLLIREHAAQKLKTARTLLFAADEEAKRKIQTEYNELVSRKNLSAVLEAVITLLQRIKNKAGLERCKTSLRTRPISDKSKEFASAAVTQELQNALRYEFNALGVGHIKTKLKERNQRGRMLHQLLLDLPQIHNLEEILSEGEQRAIALGAFLAELSLANHSCGIVFDDPVSSLDHKRRGRVARRLAKEALTRQVVIFTHDVVFLQQIQDESNKQGLEPSILSLGWQGGHCGIVSEGLPWAHQSIAARLDALGKKQRELSRLPWPDEPSEELAGQMIRQYSLLRATIERVVQDFILNGTVQRFRDYIDVNKLDKVVGIEDSEVKEIFRLMQRCHDITEAHDPASVKDDPPPTPDELEIDINALLALIEKIKARRKTTA